ncbi:MAG: DUF2807 domain-containing protein [Bacteroidales bacterium]|nr:DUF2807 domain-containing protein [Bacteroidales bacterium]MDD3892825.1 DUF2807 domain-containing protein [Bacteroidales bacterium]
MKTSNKILLTALALLIVFIAAVAITFKVKLKDFIIEGDGNIITQEQTFEPFDKLIIEGGLSIEYILGESNLLIIEADSNLMQNIETSLIDKTLKIKNNTSRRKQVNCKLTAPMVEEITISSGAKLTSKDTIHSQSLDFTLNAGGSLSLIGNFDTIVSSINAGSKATLVGTCKEMKVSINAGSELKSQRMEVDYLVISANAGSNANVNSKELEVSATSGSVIRYNEGASLKKVETSSGGSIRSRKSD